MAIELARDYQLASIKMPTRIFKFNEDLSLVVNGDKPALVAGSEGRLKELQQAPSARRTGRGIGGVQNTDGVQATVDTVKEALPKLERIPRPQYLSAEDYPDWDELTAQQQHTYAERGA
jgi:hypothetical protein